MEGGYIKKKSGGTDTTNTAGFILLTGSRLLFEFEKSFADGGLLVERHIVAFGRCHVREVFQEKV